MERVLARSQILICREADRRRLAPVLVVVLQPIAVLHQLGPDILEGREVEGQRVLVVGQPQLLAVAVGDVVVQVVAGVPDGDAVDVDVGDNQREDA